MSRAPIRTWAEADALDTAEVIAGYWEGRHGEIEPGGNHSLSFWHGWRNGAVDGGHRQIDADQQALASDHVRGAR